MRRGAALAVGAGVVLLGVIVVLSQSEQRLAGSNARLRVSGIALKVGPERRRCQQQDLPAHADSLRVFAQPATATGGGPVAVTITKSGRRLSEARVGSVPAAGPVEMELTPPIRSEVPAARLCVVNRGAAALELAGDRTPPLGGSANTLSLRLDDDVRVDFLRSGEESWWELAATVATRFGLKKASLFGPWTMWAVLGLVFLTWITTLRLLWRDVPGR